jgi:hypothetical protein
MGLRRTYAEIGGIIACELCLCGLPIAQCIKTFEDLVRQIFKKPTRSGILSRIMHWWASWYADGCYDADNLERYLKDSMGPTGRVFGHHPTVFATKVGVTATTIKDPSPVVLTNYNGLGTRSENSGAHWVFGQKKSLIIEQATCIIGQRILKRSHVSGKRMCITHFNDGG